MPIADTPGTRPGTDLLHSATMADRAEFLLSLPNQASMPELIANTRLESLT